MHDKSRLVLTIIIVLLFSYSAYSQMHQEPPHIYVQMWVDHYNGNDDTGDGSEENPYQTIQRGIDHYHFHGPNNLGVESTQYIHREVLVKEGVYKENVTFYGRGLTVRKVGGGAAFIDGRKLGPVVTMSGCSEYTMLEGFTIVNGKGVVVPGFDTTTVGGGILCDNSSPLIENNTIVQNEAGMGAGVFVRSPAISSGIKVGIKGNTIDDNTANADRAPDNKDGGGGIGIWIGNNTSANRIVIDEYNLIKNNKSNTDGGGIKISSKKTTVNTDEIVIIKENRILNNIAGNTINDFGGGIYQYDEYGNLPLAILWNRIKNNTGNGIYLENFYGSSPLKDHIWYNLIHNNSANENGGGVFAKNCNVEIVNNCIRNNTATSATEGKGGGIYIGNDQYRGAYARILSNTISFNDSDWDHGYGVYVFNPDQNQKIYVHNSIIWGNPTGNNESNLYYVGWVPGCGLEVMNSNVYDEDGVFKFPGSGNQINDVEYSNVMDNHYLFYDENSNMIDLGENILLQVDPTEEYIQNDDYDHGDRIDNGAYQVVDIGGYEFHEQL